MQTLPTRVRGAVPMTDLDDDISAEILTPESSNVYSMQYDYSQGILYVTYRADADPVGFKTMDSVCKPGETNKIGIRPNQPGATYSYGGAKRGENSNKITEAMFESFAGAHSKGQWVWSNLRECGSVSGHQYPYTLTDTSGDYVPRKATRRGFRVRNVPTVGQGRRDSRQSTLPEQLRR